MPQLGWIPPFRGDDFLPGGLALGVDRRIGQDGAVEVVLVQVDYDLVAVLDQGDRPTQSRFPADMIDHEADRSAPETSAAAQRLSDDDVRKLMIRDSINSYAGNCPCPYNRASNGSSCGRRSAYSRPGGASPLCYPQDITQEMVDDYRRARRLGQ